jgi:sarcosine oxidase
LTHFDAIVVGLGAMGSAVSYQLATHGFKILGLEQFSLNHTNGSSHGKTRIIRTAYFEHPAYVPLVQRAFELWLQLQSESGERLIEMTGGLMFGLPESALVSGAIASAKQHNLAFETLASNQVRDRFPMFEPHADEVAVYEKKAGMLFPEMCIQTHAKLTEKSGGTLHYDEPVTRWKAGREGVAITTTKGSYTAKFVIFASGPWITELVPDAGLPLQCERQTVFWFEPKGSNALFRPGRMPVFMWQTKDSSYFYGLPDIGDGVKAARHHGGELTLPSQVRRVVTEQDEAPVKNFLTDRIPMAAGIRKSSSTCLYTNTPDSHFIIDFHPLHPNVVITSPCSGHGFKFSSVIGELVREMIETGGTALDVSLFTINRFNKTSH